MRELANSKPSFCTWKMQVPDFRYSSKPLDFMFQLVPNLLIGLLCNFFLCPSRSSQIRKIFKPELQSTQWKHTRFSFKFLSENIGGRERVPWHLTEFCTVNLWKKKKKENMYGISWKSKTFGFFHISFFELEFMSATLNTTCSVSWLCSLQQITKLFSLAIPLPASFCICLQFAMWHLYNHPASNISELQIYYWGILVGIEKYALCLLGMIYSVTQTCVVCP